MPTSWFDLLPADLSGLSTEEVLPPYGDMEPSDHWAGDASNDEQLQRLYSLARRLAESAARTGLEAQLARKHEQREEFIMKCYELRKKAELVIEIFWISIKDSFQLWDKDSIGIREDWQVVWSDQDTSIPPFLKKLIGEL